MTEERHEDEVVLEEEQQDELANWFDDEDEEDLSAEDDVEEEEESSTSDDSEELDPDEEDPTDDAAEEAASEEGNSTKTKSEEYPYEWMGKLDPDLLNEVERLVHSDQSNRGRVAALQRQLDSVRAEQEARARTHPKAAAKAVADGKPIEDMDDEELAEFLEEFPEVSKNVQKLIDRRLQEELERRVAPIEQERIQSQLVAARQELRQEAQRIFNTVETGIDLDDVTSSPAFSQWLSEQPEEYQNFARSAESVRAATKVLEDFAMYTEEQVAAMMEESGELGAEEQPTERSRSADQTAARRKEARQGATPRSRTAQLANKPGQGSYEDWFDHFVEGGN